MPYLAAGSICHIAIGDMGKQVRFVILVLPILAALPIFFDNAKSGLPGQNRPFAGGSMQ